MTKFHPQNWIIKPGNIVIPIFFDTDAFPKVGAITEITSDLPAFQNSDLLHPLIQPGPRRF
ncbi:hypothetical protein CCR75_007195 [Bremia lactucae]|uniref:Uncharacterized protein n=1 Tax=Bremia lactucae TaxID=4779 RepID=A0A976FFR7_BRELC|nr:hypothetical protein CCR75_007195 [Bremia lactucae]